MHVVVIGVEADGLNVLNDVVIVISLILKLGRINHSGNEIEIDRFSRCENTACRNSGVMRKPIAYQRSRLDRLFGAILWRIAWRT